MKARDALTPISLVVLAAGAASYAYVVDRREISDADRAARRDDVFPSFRVEDVTRVDLEHDRESLVLERERDAGGAASSGWRMTSPRQEPADVAAVDALLRELELAKRVRLVAGGDAAGLDSPRVRGRIALGSTEVAFALGADAQRPIGSAYMRIDGDKAFVIGRTLKVQLLRGADAYRERTLIPYGASEVARVEVRARQTGDGFAVEREGDAFRVVGSGLRASRTTVERIFAALADTRADTFVDDALANPTGSTPAFEVTVKPRDATRPSFTLRVGGKCPGQPESLIVVRVAPSRVSACAARTIGLTLATITAKLVDDSLLFAHADEIEELTLEATQGGQPRVELARKERVWHERSPDNRDLGEDESDSANALALALADARAVDVQRPRRDDRFAIRARATIVRTGGRAREVLEIGTPSVDRMVPVRRLDDGAILSVAWATARRFEPHPAALRPSAIWRSSFDPGSVIGIDDTCSPVPQQLELRGGTWILHRPAGFDADPVWVTEFVEALAHAKTNAWIAEGDDGTFGFDGPGACAVTLTLAPGSDPTAPLQKEVLFGAGIDDGTYGRTGDLASAPASDSRHGAVFIASTLLRAQASRPAIDRSHFRLDPETIVRLSLARGTSKLSLVRVGDRLVRTTDPRADGGRTASEDSDAPERDIGAAVAALLPSAAVHPGPPARDEGMSAPTLEISATTRNDAGRVDTRVTIGALAPDGSDTYFARVAGVDATFAIPRRAVAVVLDAW